MRLAKNTRYALYAVAEMAAAGESPVTVAQVAKAYGVPANALAKTFQHLVRSGIASGTRGVGGGYRLAKAPAVLTVLDIVDACERPGGGAARMLGDGAAHSGTGSAKGRLRRLFDEVDEIIRCTFASVTLETLVRAPGAGSRAGRATARP